MKFTKMVSDNKNLNHSNLLWIFIAAISLIVLSVITFIQQHAHKLSVDQVNSISQEFEYAKHDLNEGFLHFTLGDTVDSPWQRAQGLALIYQALNSYETEIEIIKPERNSNRLFKQTLEVFKDDLFKANSDHNKSDLGTNLKLRLSLYNFIRNIETIDLQHKRKLKNLSDQGETTLKIAFIGIAIIILVLLVLTYQEIRQNSKERKCQASFNYQQNIILESIASGAPLNEVLLSIVSLIEAQITNTMGSILMLDDSGHYLHHAASNHLSSAYIKAIDGVKIGPFVGSCGTAAYEQCEVIVKDIASDMHWIDYRFLAQENQLAACWSIPFFSNKDEVLGTFAIYAKEPRLPTENELNYMRSAANIVRIAIERDIAIRALYESEALVETTFEAAVSGITTADLKGRFLMANPAYCNMLGYEEAELLELDNMLITHHEDRISYQKKINELIKRDINSFVIEKRALCKNGTPIWTRVSMTMICDINDKPKHLTAVVDDITEAKALSEAYQESQALLAIAAQASHMGGWSLNLLNMQLKWSDETAKIHEEPEGFTPSTEQAIKYYLPEYRYRILNFIEDCRNEGRTFDTQSELMTANGRKIWVRSIGQAVRDENGNIVSIQGAFIDITEQKQIELEKLETFTRLDKISKRLPGVVYELRMHADGSFSIPYASDSIKELFKLSAKEVKEDSTAAFKYLHPDDAESFYSSIISSAMNLTTWLKEFRMQYEDGKTRWLQGNAEPIREANGSTVWYGFITDVTNSRKSLEQLKLLETSVSKLNDIILITEAEPVSNEGPRILFVNDAFERRTGYSRDEVIGKTPRILQGEKTQRAELDRIHASLKKWQPVRAELINYTKTGEEFWLELEIVPVANEKGWFTHWIAVERDITERKLAEIEMSRLNRALILRNAMAEYINHANNETALLDQACQLTIDTGGYNTAWVGYAQHDSNQSIHYAAVKGNGAEYVKSIKMSWSKEVPEGQGPAGLTMRSGLAVVFEDFTQQEVFAPWLSKALSFGLHGTVCLPLRHVNKTFGILNLYLSEVRTIAKDEMEMLEAMADDLAFGIMAIRTREAEQRSQKAIVKLASSVSIKADNTFFEQLSINLTEILHAKAAFISKLLPGEPLHARSIAGYVDGKISEDFEYLVEDTPCRYLLANDEYVYLNNLAETFPNAPPLKALDAQAYAGRLLRDSTGVKIGFIFVVFDTPLINTSLTSSTLKIFASRAAAELERSAANSRILEQAALLDKAQDAILVCSLDNKITFWNKGAERLYGWTAEEVIGLQSTHIMYQDLSTFNHASEMLMLHGEWGGEIEHLHKSGKTIIVEGHWTLVLDDDGNPQSVLCINTDISDRKFAEEEFQKLALYDPLTALPNRLLLTDRLKQIITTSSRNDKISALLFIDLDNFKSLNDTMGHHVGDQLLKMVGMRLTSCVRESDTVARLGGDEFIIAAVELSEQSDEAAIQAEALAEKVLIELSETYYLAGRPYDCTASIGITLISKETQDISDLLRHADLAMYQAKAAGRNAVRFYQEEMQAAISKRVALEADLRTALAEDQFLLHYQPQISHLGEVTGAEVLIRWKHPVRGMISPLDFIPLAEETKQILPIGNWVLETACNRLVAWEGELKTANLTLAVNVSAYQFRQQDFVEHVLSIIKKTGVNPYRLKLELTESLLIDNVEDIIAKMTMLKGHGIGFSLDDFGTGYSSLSYLKRLPLDQLKIDQSFVRDVLVDMNDATIARTIVSLGKNLGLNVIAEGVETKEQRQFLLDNECYSYQGYFFSKPLPIEQFEQFVMAKL